MLNHSSPAFNVNQKGWDDALRINVKMNSKTSCDCLLHGEFHSPGMKVFDKHVYVYLYFTNIYAFVCTIGLAPAKRVKRLLNDVSPTPISYYMGVGETSFNSRFTLLAGARPMVQSSGHTIQCKNRLIKYQTKCINVNKTEVLRGLWYCPYCVQAIFPTIILMMMTFILQWLNVR